MSSKCHHLSSKLSSLITLFKYRMLLIVFCSALLNAASLAGAAVFQGANEMSMNWQHAVDLNEDFRILWTIINQDITFEIQARTLGYVGFGFSNDGKRARADVAIGWVDKGHTFFQDRYMKYEETSAQPQIDPSQDYILIMGYENVTHTVIRFRRKLDTCDHAHDIPITNGTMRLMYLYGEEDPASGTLGLDTLPNCNEAWHPYQPQILLQRSKPHFLPNEHIHSLELRNYNVELPLGDDALHWCQMFKLNDFAKKHHIVKYEPLFDSSWSIHYLQQITLYECQGNEIEYENLVIKQGRQCLGASSLSLPCNAVVASWSRGSIGFSFPSETGYALDSDETKFYLMETHYNNLNVDFVQLQAKQLLDNSGLKIYTTAQLRPQDAGVLSVGMSPNWRHIIPPGQKRVISRGYCIEGCTAFGFPPQGINIFAVMMRTHQIGKEIKLRQFRNSEELPPIAYDNNIDSNYHDFRLLPNNVQSLPGDRLLAECIYDSSSRKAITLGGLTMNEESCTVLTYYYPRQNKLTTCNSLPSLPTVLHSLGIGRLDTNSNPVVISAPPDLAGMSLESRLLSYDWQNQFKKFQHATSRGSFKPFCLNALNEHIGISTHLTGYHSNATKIYKEPIICKLKRTKANMKVLAQLEMPDVFQDMQGNYIVESAARSSRSSFIESLALSDASVSFLRHQTISILHICQACVSICMLMFIS